MTQIIRITDAEKNIEWSMKCPVDLESLCIESKANYMVQDMTKWINRPLEIILITIDGLERTKPVRMKKI